MAWKKGPLPKDTWNWGGVVPAGRQMTGFFFADFKGDHVQLTGTNEVLQAHEVAWYDNSLELPPKE